MALNPTITPLPSVGGPLYMGSATVTSNTSTTPYLPLVTWKDTLNNSAPSTTISDQQLSVAAQNQPIPILYGQTRIGPKLAYVYSYAGLLYVLGVWCHGPVDSIVTKWADDSTTSTALTVTEDFLGSTTQTPSTLMAQVLSGYGSSSTLTGVVCTGSAGQFSYTGGGQLAVGQTVTITGTASGSLTMQGYVPPGPVTYYVVATDKISTFTLSLTYNGAGIITTGSTSTGLTFVGTKDRLTSPPICYSVFKISPTTSGTTTSYSFPRYNYLIKGLKVYDPRTGVTAWSDNPALCLADFITNSTYGCGYSIDWDSVSTVANLNDALISIAFSGVTIVSNVTYGNVFAYTAGVSLSVGDMIQISGTLTGTGAITGYTNPSTYYVIWTDGATQFQVSTAIGGSVVSTSVGTLTGLTIGKAEKQRTLNLVISTPQDSISWIDTLRTYAGCWVRIIGGIVKLIPDAPASSVATYSHFLGNLLNIRNISKRGVMDVPNWLTLEHTDNTVVPYRTRPAIIDNSNGGTLKESTISMPGINRYSQAYREAVERLNKLDLMDLSLDLEIFDEGITAELGDVIGVIHPIGIGSIVTNLAIGSEGNTSGWTTLAATSSWNDIVSVRNTLTVSKLTEAATTDHHGIVAPTATIVAGNTYTSSIEIKPNGRNFVGFTPDAGGNCGVAIHGSQGFQVLPITLSGVVCTAAGGPGSAATFTCTSSTLFAGQTLTINGAMTGVTFSPGYVSGNTYTISTTNGTNTFTLTDSSGLPVYCNTTGTVGVSTFVAPVQVCRFVGTGTLLEASISALTSGFYRLKLSYISKALDLGGSNTITPRLYLSDIPEVTDSSSYTYLGDITKGVWFTALQIESGTSVNTYTPSYATSVTTSYPKLMRILGLENTSAGRYTLRCVEYDPAVYSTALVTTPTYTDTPEVDTTVVSFTGNRLVINNSASTTTLQALALSL